MQRNCPEYLPYFVLILMVCTVAPNEAGEERTHGHEAEIFRFDASPTIAWTSSAREEMAARMPFGDPSVEAYLLVVRLAPGQRFVSARVEVRDGYFCIPRRGPARSIAAKLAVRLGYRFVSHRAPEEFHETLALVSDLLPSDKLNTLRPPRLKRRVVLKAEAVEHHDGYVAALLLVAANSATRLEIERVTTRSSESGGKRRGRGARTVAFPDATQVALPRERIMSILAGDGTRRDHP